MKIIPTSTYPFHALGKCGEIVTGSTPPKTKNEYWNGDIPFITPAQLGSQDPIISSNDYVTSAGAERGRLLPKNSVLVCCIGSLGKIGIVGKPAISNQQINTIVFDQKKVDPRFGYYIASKLAPLLERIAPSTTIKIVKKSTFSEIQIPLPPLSEQKRIAGILDAADRLRAKRREALAQLDTLLQSTFLDLFGDPVTNPKGWEQASIGDLLKDGRMLQIQDGNHGEIHPKVVDFTDDGIPFIMANCMKNGALELSKAYHLPECWLSKLRIGFAKAGDTLLSHKGTIGQTAIVPHNIKVLILSPQVTYYRTSETIEASFLAGMFSTDHYQALLTKEAKQSTRAYIGITRQQRLPAIIPPLNLQQRFAAIVKQVEAQKARMRTQLSELDTLFAALQQRAFNGEL